MMDTVNDLDNWANNAFLAFGGSTSPFPSPTDPSTKWSTFDSFNNMSQPSSLTIPPATLVSQSSVERYGQITPPDDRSPSDESKDQECREGSIPVEQLHNEALWPSDQILSMSSLQPELAGQPPAEQEQKHYQPLAHEANDRPNKRRRTSKPKSDAQLPSTNATDRDGQSPKPAKRGRGRPKNPPPQPLSSHDYFDAPIASARQTHLEKNRVAAHKCRQRKKEFINTLESRARDHSARNHMLKEQVALLREELLGLKNMVLAHANCGFWPLDEYLARCAGDLLNPDHTGFPHRSPRNSSLEQSPTLSQFDHSTPLDQPTQSTKESGDEDDDNLGGESTKTEEIEEYEGLELLKDYQEAGT